MKPPLRKLFLAIRHNPTGAFLPNVRGYGFTATEPDPESPPRLFIRQSSASQALNYWLQGEHRETGDNDFNETVTLKVIAKPHRKRSDMEIVEVEIIARTLSEAELRRL